jgi:A/G-specific adenine glycosylase
VHSNSKFKIQNSKLAKLVPALLNWFCKSARDLPWRRTRDPYAIWVSEIMLQQTQVKTVIPYWERWLHELPIVDAAANASPDRIHKLWEGLGYYTRARNLQQAAKQIVEKHGGTFPHCFDDVLALPGIGRYTAGAICSIAFNQPTPILDGNVIRVLTRVFGIAENPKEKETNARLWKLAEGLVCHARTQRWGETTGEPAWARQSIATTAREDARPTENTNCSFLNQSLMELGALVCTPRNPQCTLCPVQKFCVAFRENRVNELPNLGQREAATARRFAAFVAGRNGRFYVRQRPVGVVNAYLWEFPNVEIDPIRSSSGRQSAHYSGKNSRSRLTSAATVQKLDPEIVLAAEQLGFGAYEIKPLCTVKHSITRYRITLEAFVAHLGGTSYTSPHPNRARSGTRVTRPSEAGVWKTPAQMQQLAFTAAHKKLASAAFDCILSAR